LAHLTMTRDDIVVLVTFSRIIMMSTVKLSTEWEICFQDLQTIVMERTGLSLILRGGVQGPFIPIKEPDDRRYLYSQISIAVTEFNRKHQTLS
jgi:vacuolar protein sorting-associated protein 13A/C